MQERAFALEPLCEIERERIHPVLQRTLGDIYEELKQREEQEI
jgi:7,8-dihydro-6-hydroxymethylpterin-pyrophosphokinase